MEYVKIVVRKDYSFVEKYSEGATIDILGNFLTDDVGCSVGIPIFREFINDPWEKLTSSNYSYIGTIGERVIIGCAMDWGTPDEEVFETTIDELNYVLDRWEELCKQKPKEIIITRDKGKITVEGKN